MVHAYDDSDEDLTIRQRQRGMLIGLDPSAQTASGGEIRRREDVPHRMAEAAEELNPVGSDSESDYSGSDNEDLCQHCFSDIQDVPVDDIIFCDACENAFHRTCVEDIVAKA